MSFCPQGGYEADPPKKQTHPPPPKKQTPLLGGETPPPQEEKPPPQETDPPTLGGEPPLQEESPPPRDTDNVRAVRILLECNLVTDVYCDLLCSYTIDNKNNSNHQLRFSSILLQKGNLQMFITVHGLADEKKKMHFMLVEWRLNRVHWSTINCIFCNLDVHGFY